MGELLFLKKVKAANKNDDEVIYLAVGGEVILLFFVELTANNQVKQNVERLAKNGVSIVIKTVDGMVTDSVIAELRYLHYAAHANPAAQGLCAVYGGSKRCERSVA